MDFMERLMQNHHPFKDVSVWHESSLGRLHHKMRNLRESICPNLGENFETYILKTDGPELLNSYRLCFLRKQSDGSKIQMKQVKLSSE